MRVIRGCAFGNVDHSRNTFGVSEFEFDYSSEEKVKGQNLCAQAIK